MSLAGSAVVAIWNDITDDGRTNFYEWHNREHMPERLGIAGFLRGRRYIALDGAPQYFTLYEVRDAAVLGGTDYLARLNNPTAWTSRTVRDFGNVARSLCLTELTRGAASGGFLGTLRFDCPVDQDEGLMRALTAAITQIGAQPGIVACHVCRADLAVSTARTAEQAGRPDNAVPRWVVLLEGSTAEAVHDQLTGKLAAFGLTDAASGVYALQFDLRAPV